MYAESVLEVFNCISGVKKMLWVCKVYYIVRRICVKRLCSAVSRRCVMKDLILV